MPTCGEALVKLLENYGVDTVFGIPGVHTVELYRGIPETRIRHITPRHEQGAGFMADGYARATGNPGVCLIITGPGMTNIATAMGQALADSIPMLVISSVNNTHELGLGEGRLHELPNQRNMISGVSVFSHTLLRANELPQILARAFTVFASERPGPVHIEIPLNIITSQADALDMVPYALPSPPAPAPDAIAAAAELLAGADRPLIAIGGGAIDTAKELAVLAEALDAPVINTVNAKGVLPYSHPLSVGGSGSHHAVREELKQADVILGIGTEFGETDYDFFFEGALTLSGKLIRIDIDARQLSRNVKSDLAIHSESTLAIQALINAVAQFDLAKKDGEARVAALRSQLIEQRNNKYEAFFTALHDVLPEAIIAGDSTQPTYYAWLNYETNHSRRYFHSASGFGTLGYAIPAAIGAKLGMPALPVIGLIGDGASQFTIGELASAVETQLPVIFLIWNNQGYGEIKRFMKDSDIPQIGVDIHTPDFLTLGKGFGCEVSRVSSLEDLKTQLAAANKRKLPSVIEVVEADIVDGYPMA